MANRYGSLGSQTTAGRGGLWNSVHGGSFNVTNNLLESKIIIAAACHKIGLRLPEYAEYSLKEKAQHKPNLLLERPSQ